MRALAAFAAYICLIGIITLSGGREPEPAIHKCAECVGTQLSPAALLGVQDQHAGEDGEQKRAESNPVVVSPIDDLQSKRIRRLFAMGMGAFLGWLLGVILTRW